MGDILLLLHESCGIASVEPRYIEMVYNILEDKSNPGLLRGKSIKALKGVNHKDALKIIEDILNNHIDEEPYLVRCAIFSLSDYKISGSITLISKVLYETTNEEVFNTAAYTLGLFKTEEIIKPLIDNLNKFNSKLCYYSLEDNKEMLLNSVKSKNEYSEYSKQALKLLGLN